MIKYPEVGLKVRVIKDKDCCYGHKKGIIGYITNVDRPDSFEVESIDGAEKFLHCRDCVSIMK